MRGLLWPLRWFKCLLMGHDKDTWSKLAFSRPGYSRCARCDQYYRPTSPIGLEHAAILKKAGWSDQEIDRIAFSRVPNSEVLRFLSEVRKAAGVANGGAHVIDHYEDGYIMGYYAALRDKR